MSFRLSRRETLAVLLSGILARPVLAAEPPAEGLMLGAPQPFSFDSLVSFANLAAKAPYAPPVVREADTLEKLDFPEHIQITYRADRTLWADQPYPVRLFHPGKFFKEPVSIHLVEDGQAREIRYSTDLFTFGPKAAFAKSLPPDLGFSGFRVMSRDLKTDWLAFLGASYFRSAGELDQYGLSARGIAVNSGLSTPEEFPRFTTFYIEEGTDEIVVSALLDGPSLTGAYRFRCSHPKGVLMDVEARLFARNDIERLGIAPLTSMFWYSEMNRNREDAADWRPEIHDSDGLSIWTGTGERLWRPLDNPPRVITNSFVDSNPKGFGLLQRDRSFQNYEDDGVFYEKRPSVWVEPLGQWGAGAVQLIEITTDAEIHDNIVAYWIPQAPVRKGDALSFDYRLHWVAEEPFLPSAGRVISTRRGRAGQPGETKVPGVKFAIDFAGGELARHTEAEADPPVPVITVSRGQLVNPYALRVKGTDNWRIIFDLVIDGTDPVDLRAYLKLPDGTALTETWLSQYFPGTRRTG